MNQEDIAIWCVASELTSSCLSGIALQAGAISTRHQAGSTLRTRIDTALATFDVFVTELYSRRDNLRRMRGQDGPSCPDYVPGRPPG